MRHPDGTPTFNCSQCFNSSSGSSSGSSGNSGSSSSSSSDALLRRHGGTRVASGDAPPRHTYMVHAASPYGPWSEPLLVLKANTSVWDNHTVLIDTNLAVTILPDGSAVGIWRKCENTPGTVCEHQCCTFPHLLTASDWRDPSSYVPHSDAAGRLFGAGLQPYGSEDPMLWQEQVPVPPAAAAAAATAAS